MKITDPNVKKWLDAIADEELTEMVETFPEDEIDGRSEVQVFADELSYAISCYEEDGHVWKEDIDRAREILRETRHGKIMPLDPRTLRPRYRKSDIDIAKNTVNTYRRMVYRFDKLVQSGIYGQWR